MSINDFEFLTRWAQSQGWRSLRLLGGEPTVHPEFKTILDISRQQGFSLSISTNGLFDPELNPSFDKILVESINFSYPQDQLNPQQWEIFHQNFRQNIHKEIPAVLSGVIYPDKDDWRQVIDLAKEFRTKVITRFSMILPGYQKCFNPEEFKSHINALARQILAIARYAYKNYVVFFFYRPLLLCMFSPKEVRFLKSISPFLFDSFCPCSCVDGTMITINPDLSCSPCPALFLKGIKITPQISREAIRQDFKARLKQLSIQPLIDSCQTCQFFINYQRHLENNSLGLTKELICQGGCFQYRV